METDTMHVLGLILKELKLINKRYDAVTTSTNTMPKVVFGDDKFLEVLKGEL